MDKIVLQLARSIPKRDRRGTRAPVDKLIDIVATSGGCDGCTSILEKLTDDLAPLATRNKRFRKSFADENTGKEDRSTFGSSDRFPP